MSQETFSKPSLNYNEYLRYTFSGGLGVLTFLYLNPCQFDKLFKSEGIKDSLFLLMLSLILGSFIYAIHRAFFYPVCYKINLLFLILFKRVERNKFSKSLFHPFISSELEMEMDFKRWKLRQNSKSFSNNMLDWFAQIHFLYCSVWALFLAILISPTSNNLINLWTIGVLFIISLISHYRSLIYDYIIERKDHEMKNMD